MNLKATFAVINTTQAVVKLKPKKKFRPVRDLNLRPLRYWCSSPVSYSHHCEDHFLIHFLKRSTHIYDFQISTVTEKVRGKYIYKQINQSLISLVSAHIPAGRILLYGPLNSKVCLN